MPHALGPSTSLHKWLAAALQVWRPKEASQQTGVHQGSSMPRKLRFVGGLRGAPERPLRVLMLDLDLGQPRAGSGC
jgi:hypothetical protein